MGKNVQSSNWLANVFTDIQFWVPLALLIGGLVLLKFLH
jgi:hypothetical protein